MTILKKSVAFPRPRNEGRHSSSSDSHLADSSADILLSSSRALVGHSIKCVYRVANDTGGKSAKFDVHPSVEIAGESLRFG